MPKKWTITIGILVIFLIMSLFLGSVPPSPLYYLKIGRESVQSLFIFGDEDQTNWLLTRADKRLTEAEKLKSRGLNFFADIQINTAKQYQSEAEVLLEDLKNKTNIIYLKDKYNQNLEKMNKLE